MNKLKALLIGLSSLIFVATPALAVDVFDNCTQAPESDVCRESTQGDAVLGGAFQDSVIQILIFIVGFFSLVFIIISGIRMVTAQGDPQGIAQAKSTLQYSIIGLVIALAAQGILTFVIGNVT
jgi:hypothetical protein